MLHHHRQVIRWVALAAVLALCLPLAAVAQTAAPKTANAAAEGKAVINLNQASLQELTALKGIGPVMAQRIITFREKNGPFKKVEDLLSVQGIGEKKLEQLRSRLTI